MIFPFVLVDKPNNSDTPPVALKTFPPDIVNWYPDIPWVWLLLNIISTVFSKLWGLELF